MAEVFPVECAETAWKEKYGEPHDKWFKVYLFFKRRNQEDNLRFNEFLDYRFEVLLSLKNIIEKLEKEGILESFHFLFQPFPDKGINTGMKFSEFEYKRLYWYNVIDVRFCIKRGQNNNDNIEKTKNIIRMELNIEKNDKLIDYGFWLFQRIHENYCSDDESELYNKIICRIYELFCRFLFAKLDRKSNARILYHKLEKDGIEKIEYGDFSNWKIIHCFLNSQGMNNIDEANFAIFYALERLGNLQNEYKNKYWYFPLQIDTKREGRWKEIYSISGQWEEETTNP